MSGIDLNTILNSIPERQKAKGKEKYGQLILEKGLQIQQRVQPQLDKLAEELGIDGVDLPTVCIPRDALIKLYDRRDTLVKQLNAFSVTVNTITKATQKLSNLLTSIIVTAQVLRAAKAAATAGVKLSPVANGTVTGFIFDANNLLDVLRFDEYGDSKLNKYKDSVDAVAVPLAITSRIIQAVVIRLQSIDLTFAQCLPDYTLLAVDPDLVAIADLENKADQSLVETSYRGYSLQIVEVPFSQSATRRKAVAYNSNGIPEFETGLSFTTQPQLLINELKLKIDGAF